MGCAPCAVAGIALSHRAVREREREASLTLFSILDRRGIFQFKVDNIPQIHRRGVDVYEFRFLG